MKPEKNRYQLINPVFSGKMDTVVRSRNSFNASKKLYKSISKYVNNHVDSFYMTVMNVVSGSLSHYEVNEDQHGGSIKYTITKLPGNFSKDTEKKFINETKNILSGTIDGGGGLNISDLLNDSSDSSSSDSEYHNISNVIYPINRIVYFPMPYYKLATYGISKLDRRRFSLPMFSFPSNPTLEIRLDFYKLY